MFLISDDRLKLLGLSDYHARLFGPLIRALVAVVVLAFGIHQLVVYREIAATTISVRRMSDFSVFYESSRRVIESRGDPYGPAGTPNLNPPNFVVLMTPLAALPPIPAFSIWATCSVISALFALRIIFRELPLSLNMTTATWTFVALAGAAATGALLLTAQIAWLLWGPVTWMWAAARKGQWIPAAVVLGITMSVKPFLGLLLLPFAFKRRWSALIVAVAVALTSFSFGAVVLGFGAFVSWMRAIRGVYWAGYVFNSSIFGLSSRLLGEGPLPTWGLQPITKAPAWIQPVWIVASVCLIAFTVRQLYGRYPTTAKSAERSVDIDREFATILSSALLITPLGWIYYHFFLAGPVIAVFTQEDWRRSLHWKPLVLVLSLTGLVLSPGRLMSGQPSPWATLTIGSAYFWGLLGVWMCTVNRSMAASTAAPRTTPRL